MKWVKGRMVKVLDMPLQMLAVLNLEQPVGSGHGGLEALHTNSKNGYSNWFNPDVE
jgi:hypothetical protein